VQLYDPEPSACPPALFDERKRREIESTREGEAIDRRYAGIRDAQGGVLTEEQSLEYKALRNDLQQRVDATEQLDKGAMPPPNPASATSSDFFLPDSEPQKDHDADGEVANVGGQGTNAGSRRRPRSNLADDRQIANAWKTGRYKTYADLASTIGRTKNQVKLAVDRYRKRTSRRNR
jgi:hypothetical protein